VDSPEEEVVAADAEPTEDDRPVLKAPEELARHFKTHFADAAVQEVREAKVPGNIPGSALSRPLLAHVKTETEKLRRGFPLPMVQALCREFEKKGLRFFKRGKKALHVSQVRPRPINESVSLTGQVQKIVDLILERNSLKVVDLLDALAEDFTKPEKGVPPESLELSEGARKVLKDLRWLTSEGYVIEFPDTKLALGKQPKAPAPASATEKPRKSAEKKSEAKGKKPEPSSDPKERPGSAVDNLSGDSEAVEKSAESELDVKLPEEGIPTKEPQEEKEAVAESSEPTESEVESAEQEQGVEENSPAAEATESAEDESSKTESS
jgi:hypothetical protein